MKRFLFFLLALSLGSFHSKVESASFEDLLKNEKSLMLRGLLEATFPWGAIIASPSRENPNYFFDWTRDGALCLLPIVYLYRDETDPSLKDRYFQILMNYVHANRRKQMTGNLSGNPGDTGNGEPKWNIDLSPFMEGWGRPQNDGPALRARTLIEFAFVLLKEGKVDIARQLYDGKIPAQSIIKADLEFTSHRWREDSFELWEEIKGDHFSTRHQQRRALHEGAKLARAMGDLAAAEWYEKQAAEIRKELQKHWREDLGYFIQTIRQTGGFDYKTSNLDAGVLISVIDQDDDPFLKISDEKVLATMEAFRARMKEIHPINSRTSDHFGEAMAVGLGRYPEDRYTGYHSNGEGNPWFLITAGAAEFSYDLASEWLKDGFIEVTSKNLSFFKGWLGLSDVDLHIGDRIQTVDPRFKKIIFRCLETGDQFLKRWRYHQTPSEIPSEQMNKHNGYNQGADKLTWNCAAKLTALSARDELKKAISGL